MKKILLWDPRFPERAPVRLTLLDAIAAACVRAGVAAAADPADAGMLAAGGAISPANPIVIVLQHGFVPYLSRVVLPLAVAQVAIAAGVGSVPLGSIGGPPPSNALLGEDGSPLIGEDSNPILTE